MRLSVEARIVMLLWVMSIISGCNTISTPKNSVENNSSEAKQIVNETVNNVVDITVSIMPQKYFVEKIGGKNVKVNVMIPPGVDLHNYEPKPQQLQSLNDAKAYITTGIAFETAWIDRIKAANQKMLIIDSTQGIERIPMVEHHHEGAENHQAEETLDPHIWLSPKLVKIQAQSIYAGLVKIDPKRQAEYQANLNNFITELDQLDQQISQKLTPLKNRKFIVFHPAWGYFAKDYNLEQESIEVGGQEPSAAELAKLISEAKQENIKVIFAQPEFNPSSAETIAKEIGGKVIFVSDLDENWSDNLLQVSELLSQTLKP
ncbi:zinc ABC transporter substrate-binding protein [Planktothrix agardhii 1029]|jgi:zinc transport system substrate-binding protein|nr:zinc ABC transporter substrate-binding protein [Planktothrix agardhii]MCF3567742.1 zinc ABC transporter substrate-binding protein [Planktothrix agardhii 1807]MCF3582977.1 zinc ABC transporter substrate-binding protein [Planktothrix agardhii 1811]MCF3619460.1 zinc ABC transporter substrate-binding protein [Planktothrix agardhii 1030]MBG0748852.1 zinc ABC transporter substrate-binding protein [Planktothrix agardhii KL2]MCB8776645.1 zinc ABC transporter substrate-binding protein [Planktothrix 